MHELMCGCGLDHAALTAYGTQWAVHRAGMFEDLLAKGVELKPLGASPALCPWSLQARHDGLCTDAEEPCCMMLRHADQHGLRLHLENVVLAEPSGAL